MGLRGLYIDATNIARSPRVIVGAGLLAGGLLGLIVGARLGYDAAGLVVGISGGYVIGDVAADLERRRRAAPQVPTAERRPDATAAARASELAPPMENPDRIRTREIVDVIAQGFQAQRTPDNNVPRAAV